MERIIRKVIIEILNSKNGKNNLHGLFEITIIYKTNFIRKLDC